MQLVQFHDTIHSYRNSLDASKDRALVSHSYPIVIGSTDVGDSNRMQVITDVKSTLHSSAAILFFFIRSRLIILLSGKEMLAGVHLKFSDLYRESRHLPDPSPALAILLEAFQS